MVMDNKTNQPYFRAIAYDSYEKYGLYIRLMQIR